MQQNFKDKTVRITGGTADYRHLDVSSEQDWADAVAFAKSAFDGLLVLVNNAGVALRGVDLAGTRAAWDRVLAVNLTGIDLPVDGGFTELGVYRQVWRRATGCDRS